MRLTSIGWAAFRPDTSYYAVEISEGQSRDRRLFACHTWRGTSL